MIAINVDALNYIYNSGTPLATPALHEISFQIPAGQIIGITGPSGSGKSCLLQCLAGIINPSSGSIKLLTRGKTQITESSRVGLVLQDAEQQFFNETVLAEVGFGLQNMSGKELEGEVARVLNELGFNGMVQQSPWRLSGGQQRRVALASILVTDPEILLLDEPTTGLDYSGISMIYRLITEYRRAQKTVLVVSHDLDFLYNIVDRFFLMTEGELVADFTQRDMIQYHSLFKHYGIDIPEAVQLEQKDPPAFARDFLTKLAWGFLK